MNQFLGRLPCLLFALMAGAGLTAHAAEQKISNNTLTVSLSEQGQLALLMGDQCFAKVLLPSATFKKVEFTDQLGKGVALESDTLRIAVQIVTTFRTNVREYSPLAIAQGPDFQAGSDDEKEVHF
jgi:hypothetical protein